MATTKTDICNLAISLLGDERLQLADVDADGTKAADQCLLHYDITLEELVRIHTWNCSKKRDELTTSDYAEHGWDKEATLPSDCVRPLELTDDDTHYKNLIYRIDWAIEGRKVLSNYEKNYLLYQAIPAIADMDSLFLRSFYTLLASKTAVALKADGWKIRKALIEEYEFVILPEARRVNGFEGDERQIIDSEWLDATLSGNGTQLWQARSVGDLPM